MNPIEQNGDLLQMFNPDGVRLANETVRPVFPDLVDKLASDIYGYAYRRPGIDLKTRHLVTLGVISAMGGCENQLRFQLGAALHLGIPIEQIREVFIQVQVFAGNARAFNAAAIFKSVADEFQKSE
ncbi:carboxymuconolactone decarboxylase family protein [Burkholderia cepacia]|uniref:Carboxymuconolactone decarboxylase family protein n=2 Tax=Burkholderia cepacia complex TaxID=87882 RepID=A0AAX2RTK0_BURCE|nr:MULTISPECIES: carboxymuconolactone decarboxylase family protein [Burkholderia]OUE41753.1 carboxymuconolactone decarboxylase [Burkholderia territorii]KVF12596.1 carboxymuconolactone decarboxylase [Burkholderia cepacia]KVK98254.1 carboxymuconolactone decarboxylase [Burkholderia cepacia]KVW85803.1 carboxymuconolactone decarboxylase [Burkholderia cepacia]KVX64540.1 carboxymuconolactone decarboxylase [Burkholderia cepacia]